jgi:hypothetical protein
MRRFQRNILSENMRRFRTKNLNEETIFKKASEENDGNWEEIFNDMKPSDISVNELFGWWLEVYSAIASKLLNYSKQINLGHKLNEFESDIQKIISATKTCVDKISMLHPNVYAKMRKNEAFLLNDIKDELIEELRELFRKKSMDQQSNDISEKLESIADNYQRISEDLLELSWDYTDDEDELSSSDAQTNNTSPVNDDAFNYRIKPTQKPTPWITYEMGVNPNDTEGHENKRSEMINKLKQGKSLGEIYNWLMNTQGYSHGRFASSHISSLFYNRYYGTDTPPLVPFEKIMAFGKAIEKLPNY